VFSESGISTLGLIPKRSLSGSELGTDTRSVGLTIYDHVADGDP
jgi:hypothetical protein